MGDLLLSSLRLTRSDATLSEKDFFHSLLLADERGGEARSKNEFLPLIQQVLSKRNLSMDNTTSNTLLMNVELGHGPGSGYMPIH